MIAVVLNIRKLKTYRFLENLVKLLVEDDGLTCSLDKTAFESDIVRTGQDIDVWHWEGSASHIHNHGVLAHLLSHRWVNVHSVDALEIHVVAH